MKCREFRAKHFAFVDDTLSAIDTAAMRCHLENCRWCSRHDAAVRRSLLLVRNLPRVECSADFILRLEQRIRDLGPIDRSGRSDRRAGLSAATFAVLAASILAVATLGGLLARDTGPAEVRLPPVVASIPEPEPAALTPLYVASFIGGMPMWPAVMSARTASLNMVNAELRQAVLRIPSSPED
jgi:anti-sigma factor RsiW